MSRRHLINSSVVFVIKGFTVYQMQNRSSYFKSFLSSLQSHSCGEPCILLEVRIKSNQEEKIQTFFKFLFLFLFYFSSVLVSGQWSTIATVVFTQYTIQCNLELTITTITTLFFIKIYSQPMLTIPIIATLFYIHNTLLQRNQS